mmetsp:Transcript_19662/g.33718  ORF Transcript_19662/g.33718 Transcript_19662/m.33718 type:complete len:117 (-) Transcript_19662:460-810(-)|eukprot:CAMPEP_0184695934 /NCGR_PEP_ID=MMETSP0313-20130426/3393_1 /TAXON_ID=2792 /ORGANISM="Porphyridium aerugineum, Strain SAG 1380-2" /LENGTH=116 /DNA_ID=CAMNT_0027154461 /DNA_START=215 /DNA_END=565 /DNA_ORIENTATION=+
MARIAQMIQEEKDRLLRAAAERGDHDRTIKLLNMGAGIDSVDEKGRSALMIASYFGHATVVRILRDKGADVNLQDEKGNTALTYALIGKRLAGELCSNSKDGDPEPRLPSIVNSQK